MFWAEAQTWIRSEFRCVSHDCPNSLSQDEMLNWFRYVQSSQLHIWFSLKKIGHVCKIPLLKNLHVGFLPRLVLVIVATALGWDIIPLVAIGRFQSYMYIIATQEKHSWEMLIWFEDSTYMYGVAEHIWCIIWYVLDKIDTQGYWSCSKKGLIIIQPGCPWQRNLINSLH